ncbi:siderophore-interacting protein [Streptosporangium sp. 'caverna']|uniref:siderophore-interacting protein n=1 Tax=Streptosporangium sp. 'caverna' TaxID=2202249 RepID=UPI000D7EB7D6|nr:siderophore-interacting protein [Streptosporangium sp. 'caverna']AWS42471.1 NADPH-dependent ferric siderophore reductase [Streptosporangium sp. 'caverna']
MADDRPARPARPVRRTTRGEVRRVERLTPHMIRVVLGGEGLAGFEVGEFTDHYVKLLFPPPGVTYRKPFDMEAIQRDLPRDQWPTTRTYTVRAWDPEASELTLDFVYHGDSGLAGPWADRVQPGEEIHFFGPGGGYAPDPDAAWHLLVGDESALPAIATALERLPAGAQAHVFIEVEDAQEEQSLDSPADTKIFWLHRGGAPVGEALIRAVRELDFPPGAVHAFVHGEATFVRELRRHLRTERGVPLSQLSISGYWRLGRDDEAWRSSKREWNEQIEQEEAAALSS